MSDRPSDSEFREFRARVRDRLHKAVGHELSPQFWANREREFLSTWEEDESEEDESEADETRFERLTWEGMREFEQMMSPTGTVGKRFLEAIQEERRHLSAQGGMFSAGVVAREVRVANGRRPKIVQRRVHLIDFVVGHSDAFGVAFLQSLGEAGEPMLRPDDTVQWRFLVQEWNRLHPYETYTPKGMEQAFRRATRDIDAAREYMRLMRRAVYQMVCQVLPLLAGLTPPQGRPSLSDVGNAIDCWDEFLWKVGVSGFQQFDDLLRHNRPESEEQGVGGLNSMEQMFRMFAVVHYKAVLGGLHRGGEVE